MNILINIHRIMCLIELEFHSFISQLHTVEDCSLTFQPTPHYTLLVPFFIGQSQFIFHNTTKRKTHIRRINEKNIKLP